MNLISSCSLHAEEIEMNLEYVSSVVITGITVVFIALILLVLILYVFGFISNMKTKSANKKKAIKSADKTDDKATAGIKMTNAPIIDDGIEEEIVAVISAAIAAMSEKSGKKLMLKSIKASKPQRSAWAAAGLIDNTRPF